MSSAMDFDWTPEQIALRAHARKVAAAAVERYGRHNDSWINGFSKDFAKEMAAHGWIGMTWPTEFGGGGQPAINRLIVGEELIAAGAPIAAMWFADRQMGPTLIHYGTADQQAEFLPGILSGETTWCIGMSEPDSGSDLASLTTSAVRDGDDFVINGQKIWTSFGELADYCYLICRTDADGPPHKGISEVIVPMDTPGIEVRPITDMTTNRHFCEVWFSDVRVPVANLVGVEGNVFKQTMAQLEHERGGIDRLVSNHALYLLALERLPTGPMPEFVRRSPRSKPGIASVASWSPARSCARRPPASPQRRSASAPNTRSASPSSWRPRSAPTPCCGTRSRTASSTRPVTRSWAARRTSCATSSASGYSDCPVNLADRTRVAVGTVATVH